MASFTISCRTLKASTEIRTCSRISRSFKVAGAAMHVVYGTSHCAALMHASEGLKGWEEAAAAGWPSPALPLMR